MSEQRQTRQYRSIPLRTQRKQSQGQTRNTTGSYTAIPDAQASKSFVSRAQMPIVPDAYSPTPSHTSAVRYTDEYGRSVMQQGKQRIVYQPSQKKRRRFHWLLFTGLGMIAMLLLWIAGQWIVTSVQAHNLDSTYGYPRFWQTDQVLGLDDDSPAHKSHLIFQNLNGHVVFIVIPAGDIAKASIYPVATLYGNDASKWPVIATFQDVNGDGKIDVIVEIDNQQIVFLNTGTGFKPQVQP